MIFLYCTVFEKSNLHKGSKLNRLNGSNWGKIQIFATFYCYLHKYFDTRSFLLNNTMAYQQNDADCVTILKNENVIKYMIEIAS